VNILGLFLWAIGVNLPFRHTPGDKAPLCVAFDLRYPAVCGLVTRDGIFSFPMVAVLGRCGRIFPQDCL